MEEVILRLVFLKVFRLCFRDQGIELSETLVSDHPPPIQRCTLNGLTS